MSELREEVRDRYAKAALTVLDSQGCGCGPVACCDEDESFGAAEYDAAMLSEVPEEAALASLGCGNPIAVAELREGETVLDLGSGGGIDVIISNCVINLSTEKPRVFDEMFRVLRPGGRLGISDVVAGDELSPEDRAERGSFVGCIAGAMSFAEYERELTRVGFTQVEVQPTHEVADRMYGAIVRAVKP